MQQRALARTSGYHRQLDARRDASSPELETASTVYFVEERVSTSVVQFSALHASDRVALTRAEAVRLWASRDEAFAAQFQRALGSTQFQDYFWECPPLSPHTAGEPFEFVVINAYGSLHSRRVSSEDFEEHLARARARLATAFDNLGRDAKLVVPTHVPGTRRSAYGHLAAFTREADAEQQLELWGAVGREAHAAMTAPAAHPVWLNTDGRGVPWLHVRLDQRPKYIKHSPYAAETAPLAPRPGRGRAPAPDVYGAQYASGGSAQHGHLRPQAYTSFQQPRGAGLPSRHGGGGVAAALNPGTASCCDVEMHEDHASARHGFRGREGASEFEAGNSAISFPGGAAHVGPGRRPSSRNRGKAATTALGAAVDFKHKSSRAVAARPPRGPGPPGATV